MLANSVPAGTTFNKSISATGSGTGAIMALTSSGSSSSTSTSSVVLSLANGANYTTGWTGLFASTQESTIASALSSGNTNQLQQFVSQYASDFAPLTSGSSGMLIELSGTGAGTNVGSFTASSAASSTTPEPSSYLLLSLGIGSLALLRKRSSRRAAR